MKSRISQTLVSRVHAPQRQCAGQGLTGFVSSQRTPRRAHTSSSSSSSSSGKSVTLRRPLQRSSATPLCAPAIASTRRYQSTSTEASHSSDTALPRVLVNDMTNQELIIDFNTGTALRYPSFWLRDHCPCSECQHPSTHQRQFDTFSIDPEIKVSSVQSTPAGLEILWPASSEAATAGTQTQTKTHRHRSVYPWEWLQTHPPFIQANGKTTPSPGPNRTWTHVRPPSSGPSSLPSVPYDSIISTTSNSGLITFLQTIHTLGFCLIPRTPPDPASTQSLVERISHIRPTHYGGFWDVTSAPNPIDTAYTDDYLPPHTDTTYFTDPAGLQLFHCLQPATGGGGESTFVDGFAAAQHLYTASPQHYHALSTYPIVSAALGSPAGAFYNTAVARRGYPVLVHSAPSPGVTTPSPATLVQVRWNNLDRVCPSTPSFPNHTAVKAWYSAARAWSRILESPEFLITLQLQPGEPVIFDNWRVLHGRLAFQGQRRICGAYVGMDDFRARCRALGIEV